MRPRLASRALWGLTGWAVPLVIVFLVMPRLLRVLGAETFGVLMIVLITPLIAVHIDFGMLTAGTRRVSFRLTDGKVDAGGTLASLALGLAVVGLGAGAALALVSPLVSSALGFDSVLGPTRGGQLVRACAIWVAVSLVSAVPMLVARAAQQLGWLAAVQTVATAALWLGALSMARGARPISHIVALGVVLTLASALATLIVVRRRIDWHRPLSISWKSLVEDRRFAAGTFVAQLAGALVFQGDRILVALLGTPALAGAYALCVNVSNKTLAAIVAMTSFVFPHASALEAQQDRAQFERLSQSLDRAVVIVVAPLLVPGIALAEPFLRLWLGGFSSATLVTAFQILWVAFAVPAFAVPMSYLLSATGNSRVAAQYSIFSAVVLLIAMPILVPAHGLVGAAIATLLSMSTSPTFSFAVRRRLKLPHGPERLRFWFGIGCGVLAQGVALALFAAKISTWIELFAAAAGGWLIFYLTRGALRLLSPEELTLARKGIAMIRGRTPPLRTPAP